MESTILPLSNSRLLSTDLPPAGTIAPSHALLDPLTNAGRMGLSSTSLAAPILTFDGPVTYTENATPALLSSTATVTDADSPSFNGGRLTLRFTTGGIATDRLAIRTQGTAAEQINLDGRIIKYGTTRIGTFTGGIGTEALTIRFDSAAATSAAAQALLRNLTYTSVAENLPATGSRTLELVLADGDGNNSLPVTTTITVTGVNDAPTFGTLRSLYSANGTALPTSSQAAANGPWLAYRDTTITGSGTATQTATSTGTTLTTDNAVYAGYSNYRFVESIGTSITFMPTKVNSAFPTLDRTTGYGFSFTAQVLSETHTGSDRNGDGKDDRAGFSVIVLSEDRKGIELGFWGDRIWAQEDGTQEPGGGTANNTRTLFTQAEFTPFNTTALTTYDLTVLGDTYTLFANGNAILNGRLRDYTAFAPQTGEVLGLPIILPDPYEQSSFIFLGDSTPAAAASVKLNDLRVSTTPAAVPPLSVREDTPLALPSYFISDLEAGGTVPVTVTLTATNGTITVNPGVAGGLTSSGIANNSTGAVTLTGTLNQINRTLIGSQTTYQGNLNFNGTDTVTIAVNDGGAAGAPAQTTTQSLTITVIPVNDAPSLTIGANPVILAGAGPQTIANWASFSPGPTGEASQSLLRYEVVSNTNPGIFTATPAVSANGTLTFTPVAGLTRRTTATIGVRVLDDGGTAEGGVNASAIQTFTITINPDGLILPAMNQADFNGDGKADILWRNEQTGENYLWLMDGTTIVQDLDVTPVEDLNWRIVRTDDFNGDGKADILWQRSTGEVAVWLMDAAAIVNAAIIHTVSDANWRILETDDFNGDGRADILWQRSTGEVALWLLNGLNIVDWGVVHTVTDTDWQMIETDDFNGDGRADIFWRNHRTGENALWMLNGLRVVDWGLIPSVTDFNWQFIETDDFNGDGRADLLWRNRTTGENALWLLDGRQILAWGLLPTVTDTQWQMIETDDFNGDGRADLRWRNRTTGDNAVWLLNGLQIVDWGLLPTVTDLDWQMVQTHDCNADRRGDILWRNRRTGEKALWTLNGFQIMDARILEGRV